MKERDFQAQVLALARSCGWRAYHVARVDGQLRGAGSKGFPDLVLARKPRLLFVELKVRGGKMTADQVAWSHELQGCGAEWRLWRPDDWAEVENTLARRPALG